MLFGNPGRAIAFSDGWERGIPSDFLSQFQGHAAWICGVGREGRVGENLTSPQSQQNQAGFPGRHQCYNKQIINIPSLK